jgi:hypothetical protein
VNDDNEFRHLKISIGGKARNRFTRASSKSATILRRLQVNPATILPGLQVKPAPVNAASIPAGNAVAHRCALPGDPRDARSNMIQKGLAPALIMLNAE